MEEYDSSRHGNGSGYLVNKFTITDGVATQHPVRTDGGRSCEVMASLATIASQCVKKGVRLVDATTTGHEDNRSAASEMVLYTVRTRSSTRLEPGTWVAYRWPTRVFYGVIVRGCTEVERGNLDQVFDDKGNYGDARVCCCSALFHDRRWCDIEIGIERPPKKKGCHANVLSPES